MSNKKPKWWPDNPYPKSIFPMERDKYSEIVPDEKIRTALSGMLGREFWDVASDSIWEAVEGELVQVQDAWCKCPCGGVFLGQGHSWHHTHFVCDTCEGELVIPKENWDKIIHPNVNLPEAT